ncbi:hypothetical protein [Pelomonas cellulosilytica]|uniref:Lipoprotein n=1 Tax=Pelomonas cellulosilytica TaxID=2906762 RepID=A0ABS8Y2B3_9BURK|nr:hypothetical protein [Pelomonas sp. P8]MCE4557189.1 hypothetical protein [Pelomonas sp. P8]
MPRVFRRSLAALLAPVMLASCASMTTQPARFATDGCSLFPDRSLVANDDWCDCCLAHDLAYWRGGTEAQRLDADRELRACVVRKTGNHALAETMFVGVRAGGGPQLNTPFRWGYAWPYGRGYGALTEAESVEPQTLEDDYRARNPQLQCQADPTLTRPRRASDASSAHAACPPVSG